MAGRGSVAQVTDPRRRARTCAGRADEKFRTTRNFSQALSARALAWLLPALPLAAPPPAGYRIDSAHSQAAFGVRLLWLHEINGRFRHIDGAVLPGLQPGTVVVSADIAVDSVAMDSARMRRWCWRRSSSTPPTTRTSASSPTRCRRPCSNAAARCPGG
jgi:hypothetical protein